MSTSIDSRIRTLSRSIDAAGLLLVCAVLGGASLLIDQLIAPQLEQVESTRAALKTFIRNGSRLRQDHRLLTAQEAAVDARIEEARRKIPEQPAESEFLAQLTQLAAESGLSIQDYAPGPTSAHAEHLAMEVEVLAAGEHEGLCRFLDGLPKLPRLCRLTDLRVRPPEQDAASAPIHLKLQIFYQPPVPDEA